MLLTIILTGKVFLIENTIFFFFLKLTQSSQMQPQLKCEKINTAIKCLFHHYLFIYLFSMTFNLIKQLFNIGIQVL